MTRRLAAALSGIVFLGLIAFSSSEATTGVTDWKVATAADSIQSMINALPSSGGVVYIPAGTYTLTHSIVFPTDRPVRLMGAGFGSTVLQWSADPGGDTAYVWLRYGRQEVQDLKIVGTNVSTSKRGIVIDPVSNDHISGVLLRNVDVYHTGWCVDLVGDYSHVSIMSRMEGCNFTTNSAGGGLVRVGHGVTTWSIRDCEFGASLGYMLYLDHCSGIHLDGCAFDTPVVDTTYAYILSANSTTITNCWFEDANSDHAKYFVQSIGGQGLTLAYCSFTRHGQAATAARIVQCASYDMKSLAVINPDVYLDMTNVTPTGPDIDIGTAGSLAAIIGGVLGTNSNVFNPRISDTSTGSFIGNYAQRMRMPRLTTTERTALGDLNVGDYIYNTTDNAVQVWNGSAWKTVDWH